MLQCSQGKSCKEQTNATAQCKNYHITKERTHVPRRPCLIRLHSVLQNLCDKGAKNWTFPTQCICMYMYVYLSPLCKVQAGQRQDDDVKPRRQTQASPRLGPGLKSPSQTIATSVTLPPLMKPLWQHTWKGEMMMSTCWHVKLSSQTQASPV